MTTSASACSTVLPPSLRQVSRTPPEQSIPISTSVNHLFRGRIMRRTIILLALLLTTSAAAAAATRPAGFYWTTARATAAFKVAASKQQAALLNGHKVTGTCTGMGIDPNSADMTADVVVVKGVKRYRTFSCTAVSPCFAAPWTVQVQTVSARAPKVALDPLRIKLVPTGPAPVASTTGC